MDKNMRILTTIHSQLKSCELIIKTACTDLMLFIEIVESKDKTITSKKKVIGEAIDLLNKALIADIYDEKGNWIAKEEYEAISNQVVKGLIESLKKEV